VADIRNAGGEAIGRSTDIASKEQCDALAAATEDAFGGRIDGLVNSAYIHGTWTTLDNADPEELKAVLDINALGALRMAQAVLPAMKRQNDGAIVNVSTMSTVNPFPGEGGYSAGKGALGALSRHMAKDFGPYNIRVNTTRMGWIGGKPVYDFIDRRVAAGDDRDAVVSEITSRIPLNIIPHEDDCSRAVLYFLSDYARVVTGATLDVNGGQWMAP